MQGLPHVVLSYISSRFDLSNVYDTREELVGLYALEKLSNRTISELRMI